MNLKNLVKEGLRLVASVKPQKIKNFNATKRVSVKYKGSSSFREKMNQEFSEGLIESTLESDKYRIPLHKQGSLVTVYSNSDVGIEGKSPRINRDVGYSIKRLTGARFY